MHLLERSNRVLRSLRRDANCYMCRKTHIQRALIHSEGTDCINNVYTHMLASEKQDAIS